MLCEGEILVLIEFAMTNKIWIFMYIKNQAFQIVILCKYHFELVCGACCEFTRFICNKKNGIILLYVCIKTFWYTNRYKYKTVKAISLTNSRRSKGSLIIVWQNQNLKFEDVGSKL